QADLAIVQRGISWDQVVRCNGEGKIALLRVLIRFEVQLHPATTVRVIRFLLENVIVRGIRTTVCLASFSTFNILAEGASIVLLKLLHLVQIVVLDVLGLPLGPALLVSLEGTILLEVRKYRRGKQFANLCHPLNP